MMRDASGQVWVRQGAITVSRYSLDKYAVQYGHQRA